MIYAGCRCLAMFERGKILAPLALGLRNVCLCPLGARPSVLPDPGHLPRHLNVGLLGLDTEVVVPDLLSHHRLGELPDHSQLVAEVPVEGLEVVGQFYGGITASVSGDVAVVDVQHVWRLDERVAEVSVGGVERMVDLKAAT